MQEEARQITSAPLQGILGTMAYNEEQVGNFSSILSWLEPRNNTITSIVNGEWTKAEEATDPSTRQENEFLIGKTTVRLSFATPDLLEETLNSAISPKTSSSDQHHALTNIKETSLSSSLCTEEEKTDEEEEGRRSRLAKLQNLMDKFRTELCLAEGIATEIPTWQIVEYDQPSWNHHHQMSSTNEHPSQVMYLSGQVMGGSSSSSSKKKTKEASLVLILDVSRQGYCLEKIFSTSLIPAIQFDGKFILTMSLSSPPDSSCILPIAYLIDAVNKSKIRKEPIDLLLLDRSCEKSLEVLKRKSTACKIYVGGDVETTHHHLPLHLLSGVFTPTKEAKGAHFIVDSSADVQTAVEAISVNVWTSGTKVNVRARSLLFVHQSVHKAVIECAEKKIAQLKTGTDFTLKMVDFIKRRSNPSILLPQGVKVYPAGSDLTVPTMVYDMGTSCDLIASPKSGYGHVLVVIPYRNTPELVSLSNNFDHQNQVFIYTSDLNFFKEAAAQLNGKDIWSNTSQTSPETNSEMQTPINYAILKEIQNGKNGLASAKAAIDKFVKVSQGAEKSLKSWQSTTIPRRFELLEKLLTSLLKEEKEETRLEHFSMLIKTAGRLITTSSSSSSNTAANNLCMPMYQPCGLVGILLDRPERLNFLTRIMPILVSALKGNVSTIMYVSESEKEGGGEGEWGKSVQNSFESFLPPGIVNFIRFPGTITEAVQETGAAASSQQCKFNLFWVIHEGNDDGVTMDQVSINAFSRVIIDTQFTHSSSLLSRSQQLEICKVIHL